MAPVEVILPSWGKRSRGKVSRSVGQNAHAEPFQLQRQGKPPTPAWERLPAAMGQGCS
jgi:hypothetical protein